MLKCRRILVPVSSLGGFNAVLGILEKLAMRLERIAYVLTPRAPDLDADRRRVVDDRGAHFDPP
jgi:hypothetical protein